MVMKNKKGWIRIVEAVIAIFLLLGVLLVIYSQHQVKEESFDYVYFLQKKVLDEIAVSNELRLEALAGNEVYLQNFARLSFSDNFNVTIKICNLDKSCKPALPENKEVFVEERIISTELGATEFLPKKVRIFVWEK